MYLLAFGICFGLLVFYRSFSLIFSYWFGKIGDFVVRLKMINFDDGVKVNKSKKSVHSPIFNAHDRSSCANEQRIKKANKTCSQPSANDNKYVVRTVHRAQNRTSTFELWPSGAQVNRVDQLNQTPDYARIRENEGSRKDSAWSRLCWTEGLAEETK